ncbi:MAG: Lrp/AsnC ligand binding domain-containing protein [Pikeienuella sp.]
MQSNIDQIDRRILNALRLDARLSMAALAEKAGLSKTPTLARVKRLEAEGFIRGYHAHLDHAKLGLAQVAFVQVTLTTTTSDALDAFNEAVRNTAEIEACHMIAASFDYLLKVRTRDIAAYRRTLGETISNLPYVGSTSTFIAMESVKET